MRYKKAQEMAGLCQVCNFSNKVYYVRKFRTKSNRGLQQLLNLTHL